MSEMDTYRGRLIPVDRNGLEVEAWIQKLLGWNSLDERYYSDWFEALGEEHYNQYVYDSRTDMLYLVERERLDPYGFIEASRREDGSVDFTVSYYNGGASFDEVMEAAIRKAGSSARSADR